MSQLQEYKCPACGGALAFDSKLQKMKCPYCDSVYEMAELQELDKILIRISIMILEKKLEETDRRGIRLSAANGATERRQVLNRTCASPAAEKLSGTIRLPRRPARSAAIPLS